MVLPVPQRTVVLPVERVWRRRRRWHLRSWRACCVLGLIATQTLWISECYFLQPTRFLLCRSIN